MSDPYPDRPQAGPPGDNLPVFSVSEISQAIKRTLEGNFERVRVRGEISGFKRAASGHLYLSLKDADAVLDAVCWRGTAGRLALRPEDGLEVIAIGRITSYPGRSKYQIVIEQLELAGEGALLKLLEERKRKLAAEGLFAAERKRPLPMLPEVIGVVTSPTGAVIRDILHRLADRFPRHVLLWPVLVQGEGAAGEIAAAIRGFNRLAPGGAPPRPDLLIVARGGGSLEDLWAFNEEIVVRAAAESEIPLISAVGHETDVTLIDFAADLRAPTPSAAAEMAVPVRAELGLQIQDLDRRRLAAQLRCLNAWRREVEGLARGLPDPRRRLEEASQRLDERGERLTLALARTVERRAERLGELGRRLLHPRRQLTLASERLAEPAARLAQLGPQIRRRPAETLGALEAAPRLARALRRRLGQAGEALGALERLLESLSHRSVLGRGFALVRGPNALLTRARQVSSGMALDLEFADGHVPALATGKDGKKAAVGSPKRGGGKADDPQGSLL